MKTTNTKSFREKSHKKSHEACACFALDPSIANEGNLIHF